MGKNKCYIPAARRHGGAYGAPEKNLPHFLEDELISTLKFSWKTKILLENEKHAQLENEKYPLIFEAYAHIQFWPDQRAVIRWFYVFILRDKDSADRGQKLATLIKETVPVPLTHYVGEPEGCHFSITEFCYCWVYFWIYFWISRIYFWKTIKQQVSYSVFI